MESGTPSPENIGNLETARREIFERAGKRSESEMLQLITNTRSIQETFDRQGKGRMLPSIDAVRKAQEAAGRKEFFQDGKVAYIPDTPGNMLVVGDLHGDFAALKKVIDSNQFLENMENGDKSETLVLLGDLIDRGEKDIEVMEAVLELKRRYPQNVVLLKADHEVASPTTLYPHDFPQRAMEKYYPNGFPGATIPEETPVMKQLESFFQTLPRMAVAANGAVLVHGGPSAYALDLYQLAHLQDQQIRAIFDDAMSWADAVPQTEIDRAQTENQALPSLLEKLVYQAEDSPNFMTYYEKRAYSLDELASMQRRVRLAFTNGFWFNTVRGAGDVFRAIQENRLLYGDKAVEQFLSLQGGNVMLRGHQVSDTIKGNGNPLQRNSMWTLHSTGNGSPDSAYVDRETKPRYAVFAKENTISQIDPSIHLKSVWE